MLQCGHCGLLISNTGLGTARIAMKHGVGEVYWVLLVSCLPSQPG